MPLNALVMCREQHSVRVLAAALDEFEIEQEICDSTPEALELITQKYFSALVLDFDLPGSAMVARMARLASAHRRPVIFAMIGSRTEIGVTFQAGANFVLYKPAVFEQSMRSLRVGRGFMRPDRRRSPREKIETIAYLRFGAASVPAIIHDLTEHGLSLQLSEPLSPVQHVPLRFVLPGTTHVIESTGEMIWADDAGRAGLLFSSLSPTSRKQLKQWYAKRSPKKRILVGAPRPEKSQRTQVASH